LTPAATTVSLAASAVTMALGSLLDRLVIGLHGRTAAESASTAARLPRGCPPTCENFPPR